MLFATEFERYSLISISYGTMNGAQREPISGARSLKQWDDITWVRLQWARGGGHSHICPVLVCATNIPQPVDYVDK